MKKQLLRAWGLVCLNVTLFLTGAMAQTLIIPPSPEVGGVTLQAQGAKHLVKCNDYTVAVKKSTDANYTDCFVYKTDNYASNLWGGEHKPQNSASFSYFSFSGTAVNVKITTTKPGNVTIHPLSYNLSATRSGNDIFITLSSPQKIYVQIGNSTNPNDDPNPLFLFADAPDVVPAAGSGYTIYGPGVHKIGIHKQLNTGDKIYIARGAVLEGTFYMPSGTNNVIVRGRGIINGGQFPTAEVRTNNVDSIAKYAVFTGHKSDMAQTTLYNFTFEGFIMVNSCATHWSMVDYNGSNYNNTFRNLKEVDWSVNTDNIFDGNYNIVDDCFFFHNDDCTVTRSGHNLQVTNCTFWTWLGRLLWTANYGDTYDMLWQNIDVIGRDHGPYFMNISSGSHVMRNYTFKDIRVQQHLITTGYPSNKFIYLKSGTAPIENFVFENITINDKNADEADMIGTPTAPITVKLRNIKMAGSYVRSLAEANMTGDITNATVTFENPEMNVKQGTSSIADNTGTFDFGSITSGSTVTKTFTIENTGLADLFLTGSPRVAVTGTGFSLIVDAAATVSAGGTTTFDIRFSPTSVGSFNGTISIANNEANENPYNFAITGTGTGGATNLVTNPTFDVNTSNWATSFNSPGAGTIASVTKTGYSGKACKVTVTNAGPSAWGVQVRQNIPITSGKTYTITFKASADAARTIGVAFQKNASPYTTWWMQSGISLTTSVATYGPFTFDCTTTDATNLLTFLTGGSLTDVYIDDVVITASSTLKSASIATELVSTNQAAATGDVLVYPNPVADVLKINVSVNSNAPITVNLFDLRGRNIASKVYQAINKGVNELEFDVQSVSPGSYLVKVNTPEFSKSKMIVVKR